MTCRREKKGWSGNCNARIGHGSSGNPGIGNTRMDERRHGEVWDGIDDGAYDCHDLHLFPRFPIFSFFQVVVI